MPGLLQNILWRLAPPLEVALTKRFVGEFLRPEILGDRPEVQQLALAASRQVEHVVHSVRFEQIPPDRLALQFILQAVESVLASSANYRFPGPLEDSDNATLLRGKHCIKHLRRRGYYSKENAVDHMRRLRRLAAAHSS